MYATIATHLTHARIYVYICRRYTENEPSDDHLMAHLLVPSLVRGASGMINDLVKAMTKTTFEGGTNAQLSPGFTPQVN